MRCWDSVSTAITACTRPARSTARRQQLVDRDRERVRHLLARQGEGSLADQLADAEADGLIGPRRLGEVRGPLRQQRDELVAQRVDAVAR